MSTVVDAALLRRIDAAIWATTVSRSAVDFEWPECHKRGCRGRHGDPDAAMRIVQHQIAEFVRSELLCETTTRPDVSGPDTEGDPESLAVFTLAYLLNTYNVHDAGSFVRASRLLVDAYPALVPVLAAIVE